ncbi:ArfGap-domain-containing protein [Guyanagaster necrorhizus]|uniref:ArfGap-domain-containing protein n=1 Tax=Guyanagaster necrorhizus TaxID=856835 RepID=A0A9P8APJ3_9AGAR|nr:ArfGap-domain-containing protein [Guyanagaster necrorhizus MCA 3950]KAG7442866.1 ArfGap-domain-containing protein [Guyanagaster necrorhizus MCA 3950]
MTSRIANERSQKLVEKLALLPGNDICADCKNRNPRWASHNLGIFLCVNCASIHRKIGTHITKVKSLTMDSWTKEQVENMKNMGNVKSNAIYNPNEIRHPPPPSLMDPERDSDLEQYIRSKYEYKRFLDKSALVASKLGPSRSVRSISPRPQTTPLKKPTTTPTNVSRPSTATLPQQPRSASQPMISTTLSQAQTQPAAQPQQQPQSGVWADLVSLQTPSVSSSLPLQYQAPPQQLPSFATSASLPAFNTQLTTSGFQPTMGTGMNSTGMGMGLNPFQPQPQYTNPFPQQSFQHMSVNDPFPQQTFAPQQQQYFANQPPMQSPTIQVFAPIPQLQGQFSPSSPTVMTTSPQLMSTTPQLMSTTPQIMSTTPQVTSSPGISFMPQQPQTYVATGPSPMGSGAWAQPTYTNNNTYTMQGQWGSM